MRKIMLMLVAAMTVVMAAGPSAAVQGRIAGEALAQAVPSKAVAPRTSRAQRPKMTINPGRGVGRVMLGMTERDVRRVLGRFNERAKLDDDVVFFSYFRKGLSVRFDDAKVSAIFAYTGRPGGYDKGEYKRFAGAIDGGLDFDLNYSQVVAAFGTPDKSGDNLKAPVPVKWISYPKRGIAFTFVAKTDELVHVDVQAPRD